MVVEAGGREAESYQNVKSTGISLLRPPKKKEKIQQLKLICAHITVAAAARAEEKPGNSNAGTFPAVTKSHSNENAAHL